MRKVKTSARSNNTLSFVLYFLNNALYFLKKHVSISSGIIYFLFLLHSIGDPPAVQTMNLFVRMHSFNLHHGTATYGNTRDWKPLWSLSVELLFFAKIELVVVSTSTRSSLRCSIPL